MAKDYEDPKPGAAIDGEYSRRSKHANVPGSGVYEHPESGQRAIVQGDPLWGNTQAQGFARLGFKFVREATEDEVKTLPELAMDSRKAEEGTLKGITARLDQMDSKVADTLAENKALTDEVSELREKLAEAEKAKEAAEKEAAKTAKADKKEAKATSAHVAEAGASQVSDAQAESAEHAKENAAKAQDSREQASGDTNTKVTEKAGK